MLQDKLEDADKQLRLNPEVDRVRQEESMRELKRYKELLDIREKEVETLRSEL